MNKAKRLGLLREEWLNCERCGLCKTRTQVVFGEGDPEAKLVILGEAPGAEEDRTGRPFMGEAGKILDTFLRASNIVRENVFILNVLGCRPTAENIDDDTGKTFITNRAPSKEERAACRERLLETIYTIDPFLIVALGQTALGALLGRTYTMAKMRGNLYTMHFPGKLVEEIRYPVLAMYHPAFLARNLDYSNPEGVWFQTARDFKVAKGVLSHIDLQYFGIKEETNVEEPSEEPGKEPDEEPDDTED